MATNSKTAFENFAAAAVDKLQLDVEQIIESPDHNGQREVRNVRTFSQRRLAELIIDRLSNEGRFSSDGPSFDDNVELVLELFDAEAKELGGIETLQRCLLAPPVETPARSFSESDLKYEDYLRQEFKHSISRAYLPVSEIDDKVLRKRISVEKSRGRFPEDLDKICLTQNELASLFRQAVGTITGLTNTTGRSFASFARTLVPTAFR